MREDGGDLLKHLIFTGGAAFVCRIKRVRGAAQTNEKKKKNHKNEKNFCCCYTYRVDVDARGGRGIFFPLAECLLYAAI